MDKAHIKLLALGLLVLLPDYGRTQTRDRYADAVRFFELGRTARAATELQNYLREDPDCVECYDLLARIATSDGQDSLAADWYRRALQIEPENSNLLQMLGIAEHRFEQYDQALTDLLHSLSLNPTSGESHFALGNIWFDLDSLELAKQGYIQAIDLDSTVAKYYFQLGLVYFELDYPDSALTKYQSAYQWYPKLTQAYELAAKILIDQRRWGEVVTVLEPGLALAAETLNTRYWLGSAHVELGHFQLAVEILAGYVQRYQDHIGARYNYGIALYHIGEYERASAHLTVVIEQKADLLDAHLYLGKARSAMDQDSLAFAVFDSLLILDPLFYEAWIDRGDIHLKRGRYDAATTQYWQGELIEPERWEAYHRQAIVQYYRQNYRLAEELLYSAWHYNDSTAAIYQTLGDVAAALGEDDFAAYYYSRVLRLQPEDTPMRLKLVDALVRQQFWSFAQAQLLWLIEQDPDNESTLYRLARITQSEGDTTAAQIYFEEFTTIHNLRRRQERLELRIVLDSRNPRHHRELGILHREQGNESQARESFRRAVALGDTTLSASDYLQEGEGP